MLSLFRPNPESMATEVKDVQNHVSQMSLQENLEQDQVAALISGTIISFTTQRSSA